MIGDDLYNSPRRCVFVPRDKYDELCYTRNDLIDLLNIIQNTRVHLYDDKASDDYLPIANKVHELRAKYK